MKIIYLKHSGFVVEYEDIVLIFDYYEGQIPVFSEHKKIYVFASHNHFDHFRKKIFQWATGNQQITYILSDDIPVDTSKKEYKSIPIVEIGSREDISVGEIRVRTFRSTDEGVAFLVSVKDKVIYHAGDLNWWHWEEESPVFNELMKRNFQHEINRLCGEKIHVAFVPLDARQGGQYYWGMDYFMKHTDTEYVFPMHMWEDYSVYDKLMKEPEAKSYKEKVMKISKDGEVFELCM